MTGGGVWDDMPMPQWPADGELPPAGDAAFDALLDRCPLPGDSASELRQLAGAFGELYAAPVASEPAAEQQAMSAFRAALGQHAAGTAAAGPVTRPLPAQPASAPPVPAQPARSRPGPARPRRRQARRPRLSARVAAIGTAVVVSLGGAAAAAAYTGALPGMLHRPAPHHPATLASSPHLSPSQPATESTSAAPGTRPGLCAAYHHALAVGSPGQQREAFRKLVHAAGGAGNVTSYCAGVAEPQPTPGGQATHPAHPAHPTHPPHPTHPAHPSHPSHGHKQGSAG
jgi:uracil-DNA glycosylase